MAERMPTTRRPLLVGREVVLALVTALAATPGLASVDWSLNGSLGYDDNPGRLEHGGKGSATAFFGGALTVDESRPRLDAKAGANVGYEEFLSGGYSGQFVGSLSADIRYAIIPKTLFWSLDERFGQGTANVLAPATPGNRLDVNNFSTGPTLVLPLNTLTRLQADARVGFDSYGRSVLPNDTRYTGSLALIRQISPLSSVSLNGDYTKLKYGTYPTTALVPLPGEPPPNYAALGDFDRESAFLRYLTHGKRDTFTFDAGAARVKQNNQTFDSPLVRFDWSHQLSGWWNLDLAGGREYTDGALNFGNSVQHSGIPLPNQPPPGVFYGTQNLPLTNQPMRTDSLRAGAAFTTTRTTFTLGGTLARDRFVIVKYDDDNRYGVDAGVTRRLTPFSDLHVGASYQVRQFLTLGVDDKTTYGNVVYNWQFDPSFQLFTGYNFEKRSSTAHYGYTDNRVYVGLRYTPTHGPRPTQIPGGSGGGGSAAPPAR